MEQDIFYDMFLLFSLLSQKIWLPLRPSREVAGAARQFCTISCGCCLRGAATFVKKGDRRSPAHIPISFPFFLAYASCRALSRIFLLFYLDVKTESVPVTSPTLTTPVTTGDRLSALFSEKAWKIGKLIVPLHA